MSTHSNNNLDSATHSVNASAVSLPTDERLTEQEVHDILAQWNAETAQQEAASTQPSLAAVADTLGIPEADARRLLTTVRRKRQATGAARHKRLTRTALLAAGIVAVWGYAFNSDLAQTNRQQGTFAVQSIRVRSAIPADNIMAYPLNRDITRMDVRLRYNPPSLWHFLVGPSWQPSPQSPYLVTHTGERIDTFPLLGGSRAGITEGWLHHTGVHEYTEGFAFPTAALHGGTTLWFSAAADDISQQTLAAAVQTTE